MNKFLAITTVVLLNLIQIFSVNAQIKLPEIISSNMVLQRNTTINLWGLGSTFRKNHHQNVVDK